MPGAPGAPCWVLTGAEAHSCQGVSYEKRELSHTSLIFIGHAYGQLRHAGVPRSQIIVIAQLQDYLTFLTLGADGKLGAGMPSAAFQFQKRQVEQSCALLMAEGGAHYDGEDVNPSTFMDVLLGQQPHTGVTGPPAPARPVVPADCTALFFAIYSHGDVHTAQGKPNDLATGNAPEGATPPAALPPPPLEAGSDIDELHSEWFCHFPFPTPEARLESMYEYVATTTANSGGKATHYLYSSNLNSAFIKLFQTNPRRPVVGLLNFCFSGGCLGFLKRPAARLAYNSDAWPLFLVSSSQANYESLVAGMWTSLFNCVFEELGAAQQQQQQQQQQQAGQGAGAEVGAVPGMRSLHEVYMKAMSEYRNSNQYELLNKIKDTAVPENWHTSNSYHTDLAACVTSGPGGSPDYDALAKLQAAYKDKGFDIRYSWDWQKKAELVTVVREAVQDIAQPDVAFGSSSGVERLPLSGLFLPALADRAPPAEGATAGVVRDWTCAKCTFINSAEKNTCAMCQSIKP